MSATSAIKPLEIAAIRQLLESNRAPNNRLAFVLFCFDMLLYAALCLTAVLASRVTARVAAGATAGLVGLRLASIAHDAAHQSYTSNRKWNRFIGRVAFLPSLQPLATWQVAHNVIHHPWTSIRHKDYVWIPLSKAEYDALPRGRRLIERIYRSPFGQGLYYLVELWWRLVALPSTRWQQVLRPAQRFDILLVAFVAVIWGVAAGLLGAHAGHHALLAVFCGEVVPFLSLCQFFGWMLYVQHTHPRTGFYADRSDWEFFAAQSANSTHIEFPGLLDKLLHGLFDHTAHHLDVRVPFYRLRKVESQLDRVLNARNVVMRWSPREFLCTTRVCKLYDYERRCWTDFDGHPTAFVDAGSRV
jgi:omega-6 fatty acid desaturase (delta-12 desaturase)